MDDEDFKRAVAKCPQAFQVRVFFCNNPECHRPHIVLEDKYGKPFAQFVVPDYKTGGFMDDLQDACYRSSVERSSDH